MRGRTAAAAAAIAAVAVAAPGIAWADNGSDPSYPPSGGHPPQVLGNEVVRTPQQPTSTLPFTGQEIALMSLGGGALVLGGVGALALGRRRRAGVQH